MPGLYKLKIAERIASCTEDIVFYVHPKSHKEVHNYGRTHGKKGYVDKIFSYSGRSYA